MRQFVTSVLERQRTYQQSWGTHPFETGWASEAIFFINVEKVTGEAPVLTFRVQISVDGVNWIDEGTTSKGMSEPGTAAIRVRDFGGWLRLWGEIEGKNAEFTVTCQIALKE